MDQDVIGGGEEEGHGRATRASDAYALLRQDIIDCRLQPGSRIRFEEMRDRYSLSFGPLREALMKLVSEGLVTTEERKGFRVALMSRDDLLDIIHMRKELDIMGARLSLENGDAKWEADLVAAHETMRSFPKFLPNGLVDDEWEVHHRAFHTALVNACGSPWLLRFRDLLYDQLARYKRLSAQYLGKQRDDSAEHAEILEAALQRDGDAVVYLLRRHINLTQTNLLSASDSIFGQR